MKFESVYLEEWRGTANKDEYQKAHAYYNQKKAESNLKNALKYTYGKVVNGLSREQIFQLEGSGNTVLTLRYPETNSTTNVVLQPNQVDISKIKSDIKKLGFKIKMFN